MSARFLTAYLVSIGLLAGIISQSLAKPPDLPAKVQISCEKSPGKMVLKTYAVADLVIPWEDAPGLEAAMPMPAPVAWQPPYSAVLPQPIPAPGLPVPHPAPTGLVPPSIGYAVPQPFGFMPMPVNPPPAVYQAVSPVILPAPSLARTEAAISIKPCCPACASGKCAGCPTESCCQVAGCMADGCSATQAHAQKKTLEDQLIRLIVNNIKPESWDVNGGRGTIDFFPLGFALTINQTHEIQEQVAHLLADLRHLQDEQIAVEVRVISVPQGFGDQIACKLAHCSNHCENECCETKEAKSGSVIFGAGVNSDAGISGCICVNGSAACDDCCHKNQDSKTSTKKAFLSEVVVQKYMEALQANPKTNVMMAPKITVFNGQTGNINISDQQFFVTNMKTIRQGDQQILVPENHAISTGIQFSVKPTISANHRYIQMGFELEESTLDTPPDQVPLFPAVTFITPIKEDGTKCDPVPFTQYLQQPSRSIQRVHHEFCVPGGQTALFKTFTRCEKVPEECGVPVLSWLPYVGDMFKTVGYHEETSDVWVMVTPRLIASQEEEMRPPVADTPPDTVSDNLEKLAQAQTLLKEAEFYRRTGHAETAQYYYELVSKLCPGSRYAHLAMRHLNGLNNGQPRRPMDNPAKALRPPVPVAEYMAVKDSPELKKAQELADYLSRYWQACAEGKPSEAVQWAVQALAIDPACFSKCRDAGWKKHSEKLPAPSAN
jgi:general secretion pathway protein D